MRSLSPQPLCQSACIKPFCDGRKAMRAPSANPARSRKLHERPLPKAGTSYYGPRACRSAIGGKSSSGGGLRGSHARMLVPRVLFLARETAVRTTSQVLGSLQPTLKYIHIEGKRGAPDRSGRLTAQLGEDAEGGVHYPEKDDGPAPHPFQTPDQRNHADLGELGPG
ncbi:hypothetical protein LZ30DRAFT_476261 [Colletotrichum cereale]|nr:hypothetical protein LZ30DRAFT_476261 [Colletotrichum cereale]